MSTSKETECARNRVPTYLKRNISFTRKQKRTTFHARPCRMREYNSMSPWIGSHCMQENPITKLIEKTAGTKNLVHLKEQASRNQMPQQWASKKRWKNLIFSVTWDARSPTARILDSSSLSARYLGLFSFHTRIMKHFCTLPKWLLMISSAAMSRIYHCNSLVGLGGWDLHPCSMPGLSIENQNGEAT